MTAAPFTYATQIRATAGGETAWAVLDDRGTILGAGTAPTEQDARKAATRAVRRARGLPVWEAHRGAWTASDRAGRTLRAEREGEGWTWAAYLDGELRAAGKATAWADAREAASAAWEALGWISR